MSNQRAFKWLASIFPKLTPEERDSLFYLSLFDATSWEYDIYFDFKESEIRAQIKSILKSYEFYEIEDEKIDLYIFSNFYNGDVVNQLISLQLEELEFKTEIESKSTQNIDLLLKTSDEHVYIELKRFLSTSNLREQLDNYIKKINVKCLDKNKHFFVILIPLSDNDNFQRYKKILWGYGHLIEYKFKNECGVNAKAFAIPAKQNCSRDESALYKVGDLLKEP